MTFKETLRLVIMHFFVITLCIFLGTTITNLFNSKESFNYLFPIYVFALGVLMALPSFIFYSKKEYTKKGYYGRLIIHFLIILTILLVFGYFSGFYHDFSGGLGIVIMFLIIYVVVSLITYLNGRNEAKKINDFINKINK